MIHKPVLAKEVIELMEPKPGEHFIDCTLGDGGHTLEILKSTAPNGRVLAFELDDKAILTARARLKKAGQLDRVDIIRENFRDIKKYKSKLQKVDGILADLGLRSGQLDEGGKGFTFQKDEPLDMRFGDKGESAKEITNTYTIDELSEIFRKYGEEKNHRHIAKAIKKARKTKSIDTTAELVEIILEFYRQKLGSKKEVPWIGGLHPATRVFQALRIEVNDELGALEKLLKDGVEILSPEGRIGIISYHSLEDRIVKRFYRTSPHLVQKTKKPITPGEEEARANRRARSAKLRVAIKENF
ncbi:16S rRNA (cytosine(1402)-N(4))-methyltransferase RsmH [Patescibacteria group bacterium]